MEISYNVLQRNSVNSYLKKIFAYNVGEIITGLVFTQNAGKLYQLLPRLPYGLFLFATGHPLTISGPYNRPSGPAACRVTGETLR